MNKEKYESLPADLKALIDNTTGLAMTEKLGAFFDAENENAKTLVLAHGGKITDFTPDVIAAMRAATASIEAEWVQALAAKNIDGKALAAAARELAGAK